MANYYGSPMVLDTVWTASTIPAALTPSTSITDTTNTGNFPINVKRLEWFNPVNVADTFKIVDINGNILIEGYCETANVSQVLWAPGQPTLPFKMGQWVLSTLASGKIVLWY